MTLFKEGKEPYHTRLERVEAVMVDLMCLGAAMVVDGLRKGIKVLFKPSRLAPHASTARNTLDAGHDCET